MKKLITYTLASVLVAGGVLFAGYPVPPATGPDDAVNVTYADAKYATPIPEVYVNTPPAVPIRTFDADAQYRYVTLDPFMRNSVSETIITGLSGSGSAYYGSELNAANDRISYHLPPGCIECTMIGYYDQTSVVDTEGGGVNTVYVGVDPTTGTKYANSALVNMIATNQFFSLTRTPNGTSSVIGDQFQVSYHTGSAPITTMVPFWVLSVTAKMPVSDTSVVLGSFLTDAGADTP
jgi:hypothetical protein